MKSRPLWLKNLLLSVGALALTFCLIAVSALFYFQRWLQTPLVLPAEGYTYNLQAGRTLSHLAHDLAGKEILRHPKLLTLYTLFSDSTQVHAGEYFLSESITPQAMLEKLRNDDVVLYQVTLVEGWTYKQTLAVLQAQPAIKSLLAEKNE